jgi:hypothetical protein
VRGSAWSLKRLHRAILTSAVYVQDSADIPANAAIDPDNRKLWRMTPRRLEAEALRDAMLVASGTLNRAQYGPAVKPPISSDAIVARNLKDGYPADIKDTDATRRRSVYLFHKRVVPYPLLAAFDAPEASQSCGRRNRTTVAPQALALLNDPFVRSRALDFADRLRREAGDDPTACAERGFRVALGRAPSELESKAARDFIAAQLDSRKSRDTKLPLPENQRRALADFCQAMFGLNEFAYVD